MITLQNLKVILNSLSIYKKTDEMNAMGLFQKLINEIEEDLETVVLNWSNFYSELVLNNINASLPDYMFDYVLSSKNAFSEICSANKFGDTESHLRLAVKKDLDTISFIGNIKPATFKVYLEEKFAGEENYISSLPEWSTKHMMYNIEAPWGDSLLKIADHYSRNGYGVFASGNLFSVNSKFQFVNVKNPYTAKDELEDKELLAKITEPLDKVLDGNQENVMFVGDNSLISKAIQTSLLNAKYSKIKIIKLTGKEIARFDSLVEELLDNHCHFILFADNIEYLVKNHYSKIAFALGQTGIQYKPNNISLWTSLEENNSKFDNLFSSIITL